MSRLPWRPGRQSVRTPAELLADAAELATAGRTARWLDELVADGHLSPRQRADLAAEDGAANLTRLLRQTELPGHDPRQVLRTAIEGRTLRDARQLTNVLHHRITEAVNLDPIGDSFREWVPRVEDSRWQQYLDQLAAAADARSRELARDVLETRPQWAVEGLGPVSDGLEERGRWAHRAGVARPTGSGHDVRATALGSPPRAGQAEAYASWRAAWRALGRPEADRAEAEAEMSDGQLRIRVRAWERERTWGPRYVATELAGTLQATHRYRAAAALRAAEADAASADVDRDRLAQQAREAQALADVLDVRAAELAEAEHARAVWYAHTAPTHGVRSRRRSRA